MSGNIPSQVEEILSTNRRGFLKTAGLLFVGMAAPDAPAADAPGPYPVVDPRKLDSWIVIHQNNTATFYVGKTDPGQGTGTGFRQLMADELDIAFDKRLVRYHCVADSFVDLNHFKVHGLTHVLIVIGNGLNVNL